MADDKQRERTRVRVEAPADMDPLVIAQAVVGPHVLLKAEHTHGWRVAPFNHRWLALTDLYKQAVSSYVEHMKKMIEAIEAYVGEETDLVKAMSPRPMFTPAQVQEIAALIRMYHTSFVLSIAPDAITKHQVEELVRRGILPPKAVSLIEDSYLYGQFVSTVRAMDDKVALKKLDYDNFKKRVAARPIALTPHEKAAVSWAKQSAAMHVTGLGNKIADDFSTIAIESDRKLRKRYENIIETTVSEGIERRDAWRRIASDLGHETDDWARDFGRIAATEQQRAMQEGFAQGLKKREGDPKNVMVAKIPNGDACKHCIRLHLTGGQGSAPRVFPLSELESNGSNVGRKAAEWKAVVGTTHPWCACELIHVPPGWSFEEEPPKGEGWKKAQGGSRYSREVPNPSRAHDAPKTITEHWIPQLVPDATRKSVGAFERDLRKAMMTFGDSVPENGVTIRIGDPMMLREVDKVVKRTPARVFSKKAGITLITTDTSREGSALEEHDLGYWTGNEVRLSQTLPPEKVARVLMHEIGHALNVHLMGSLGSVESVRKWHDELDAISKKEGYVSDYAKKLPIENAAEVTRMYIYERQKLMLDYPKQFTFVHHHYRPLFRGVRDGK